MAEQQSVTYSTRLNPKQQEVVDKAAGIMDATQAKFIRTAAVNRAVHVVNAAGDARDTLADLATKVARQLRQPKMERVVDLGGATVTQAIPMDEFNDAEIQKQNDVVEKAGAIATEWRPERLTGAELEQVEAALKTAGSVFVELVAEAWDRPVSPAGGYQPSVDPADLERDDD